MKREKALYAAEVMKAYAEGKEIEISICNSTWKEINEPGFDWINSNYRIKSEPESKYRAFKDYEECITEMMKHNPFGWIRSKKDNKKAYNIKSLNSDYLVVHETIGVGYNYNEMFNMWEFLDGTPFGILEE